MNTRITSAALSLITLACTFSASADSNHSYVAPEKHAPIGVMGDHMHKQGEMMFSYRWMHMNMSGNLQGSDSITNNEIATTVANPYANPPMSPPTVRVVPQDMTTNMHMFGMMYAPTNDITLMAMVNFLDKDMDLLTYKGGMGTETLGEFSTSSSGLADTKLGLLYRLSDDGKNIWHLNANWIVPTGSTDEKGTALTPMNMQMEMRLPYGMQLGSGSHGLELGLTYNYYGSNNNAGAQVMYSHYLGENNHDYTLGDTLAATAWYSHRISDAFSLSGRIQYQDKDSIDGMDKHIMAPVTTANPDSYGGTLLNAAVGVNTVVAGKHRLALEYLVPIDQDANGVQMKMDSMLTVGYQIAF